MLSSLLLLLLLLLQLGVIAAVDVGVGAVGDVVVCCRCCCSCIRCYTISSTVELEAGLMRLSRLCGGGGVSSTSRGDMWYGLFD